MVMRWYRRGGICRARDPRAVPGDQARQGRVTRAMVQGRQGLPGKERQ
jgi:hypothetical protein